VLSQSSTTHFLVLPFSAHTTREIERTISAADDSLAQMVAVAAR